MTEDEITKLQQRHGWVKLFRDQLAENERLNQYIKIIDHEHAKSLDEIQAICQRDSLGTPGDSIKASLVRGYEKLRADNKRLTTVLRIWQRKVATLPYDRVPVQLYNDALSGRDKLLAVVKCIEKGKFGNGDDMSRDSMRSIANHVLGDYA